MEHFDRPRLIHPAFAVGHDQVKVYMHHQGSSQVRLVVLVPYHATPACGLTSATEPALFAAFAARLTTVLEIRPTRKPLLYQTAFQ